MSFTKHSYSHPRISLHSQFDHVQKGLHATLCLHSTFFLPLIFLSPLPHPKKFPLNLSWLQYKKYLFLRKCFPNRKKHLHYTSIAFLANCQHCDKCLAVCFSFNYQLICCILLHFSFLLFHIQQEQDGVFLYNVARSLPGPCPFFFNPT